MLWYTGVLLQMNLTCSSEIGADLHTKIILKNCRKWVDKFNSLCYNKDKVKETHYYLKGENKMDKKSYRELMIAVLQMQMVDWSEIENDYQEGINRGLEIAIEKLQCSSFLTDT